MKLSYWPILTLMLVAAAAGCSLIRAPEEESQAEMLRKMADAPLVPKPKSEAVKTETKPADDPALAKMLADIDQMTHLGAEQREQLKQDIAQAKPSDRAYFAAVIRRATLPAGEEGQARKVSFDPPAAAQPPASPHDAPQGPLPIILGPSEVRPAVLHEDTNPRRREPARPMEPARPEALPQVPVELSGGLPGPVETPVRETIGAAPVQYPVTATPDGPPIPSTIYPAPYFPAQPSAPANVAATPAIPPPAAAKAWRSHLRDAIAQLERDLKTVNPPAGPNPAKPGEVMTVSAEVPVDQGEREVLLRLMKLAAGEREDAVRRSGHLPAGEQEFWTHQMHTLATLLDPDGAPVASRRAALALKALRDAEAQLAAESSLEVKSLAFCSEVRAFGSYAKFAVADFDPGQEVLLYAEIDNFRSDEAKGGYRTSLQGSYHILDASGRSVAEHSFPVDEDHCTSRRRDFFIPFRLYLPKLSPGEYTLQLTVEDQLAKKFGQGTIALRIKGRR